MKTCLIVDDSSTIRKIVRAIYEEFGFACVEAENGQVAYDYCAGNKPDVVMLDWNMPVMNGIEFVLKLGEKYGKDKLPCVIFCTTENDMTHISQALDAGASDYIMKPFERDILGMKLSQLGLIDLPEG